MAHFLSQTKIHGTALKGAALGLGLALTTTGCAVFKGCGGNPCRGTSNYSKSATCGANPCAAKKNPCAAKKNPCAAKANPCAAKKANPCAAAPCGASQRS